MPGRRCAMRRSATSLRVAGDAEETRAAVVEQVGARQDASRSAAATAGWPADPMKNSSTGAPAADPNAQSGRPSSTGALNQGTKSPASKGWSGGAAVWSIGAIC